LVTASQLSHISQQPLSTALPHNGTLALTVQLSTNQVFPPAVQLYFESEPIAGATGTNLVINNVQPAHVGLYRAYFF
ncbi:hypothetical protein OEK97_28910, partial [Escherichia coli]|uniref:immunoglobulin domain-containing protein n=1 Tax=Escherichia coli TaxID=562 RepID=UPI0021D89C07